MVQQGGNKQYEKEAALLIESMTRCDISTSLGLIDALEKHSLRFVLIDFRLESFQNGNCKI